MNTSLHSASKKYYLFFNLPLQIISVLILFFIEIDFYIFFYCFIFSYIIIYWIGIQAGSHKLFSHKSWIPKFNWIKYFLAILSCYGLMGGPISWSRVHRWHHRYSDTDNDPHSPKKGILFSYYKWLLNPPDVPIFVIKDYLKDKKLVYIEKNCKKVVVIGLLILFFINFNLGSAVLLSMVLTFHSEMFVNSFMHKKTTDKFSPINNLLLSPFLGGSTLHKNHHDDPINPCFSKTWKEIDLSYLIILLLKK